MVSPLPGSLTLHFSLPVVALTPVSRPPPPKSSVSTETTPWLSHTPLLDRP